MWFGAVFTALSDRMMGVIMAGVLATCMAVVRSQVIKRLPAFVRWLLPLHVAVNVGGRSGRAACRGHHPGHLRN